MTRAEAIGLLSGLMFKGKLKEALDMAISSLETDEAYQLEYERPTTKNDKAHNLCNSCTNIGCEFQSGIVRTNCAFYMPPHIEPDNCGNYVVQGSTTKNDLGVDCISRAEAKAAIRDKFKDLPSRVEINTILNELPSVTPQETGSEWEHDHEILKAYSDGASEVLDKIRDEIDKIYEREGSSFDCLNALDELKEFLDKYKAETEG